MQISQLIQEYLKCSKICENINYQDKLSVKKSNASVTKMYKLVREASNMGKDALSELAKLLDEPIASKWLAHQLIEETNITHEIVKKCFSIVEKLASGNDVNASGEKIWLSEWKEKKRMKGHTRSSN